MHKTMAAEGKIYRPSVFSIRFMNTVGVREVSKTMFGHLWVWEGVAWHLTQAPHSLVEWEWVYLSTLNVRKLFSHLWSKTDVHLNILCVWTAGLHSSYEESGFWITAASDTGVALLFPLLTQGWLTSPRLGSTFPTSGDLFSLLKLGHLRWNNIFKCMYTEDAGGRGLSQTRRSLNKRTRPQNKCWCKDHQSTME